MPTTSVPGLLAQTVVQKTAVLFCYKTRHAIAGATIRAGQALVILSAMKMETSVAAPCEGVVQHVAIEKGDSIDAGVPACLPHNLRMLACTRLVVLQNTAAG